MRRMGNQDGDDYGRQPLTAAAIAAEAGVDDSWPGDAGEEAGVIREFRRAGGSSR